MEQIIFVTDELTLTKHRKRLQVYSVFRDH